MPNNMYACGSKTEKQTSKEVTSTKKDKKDCCGNDNKSEDTGHNNCGGKCGHSKCACPSSSIGFTIVYEINFKNNFFDFSSEKQKYFHSETFVSSGFFSLWLIPKIS